VNRTRPMSQPVRTRNEPGTPTISRVNQKASARPWRWIALAVLVVLVGVGGVRFQNWRTHPHLFGGFGDEFERKPMPLAQADLTIGVTYPPIRGQARVVMLHGARALLTPDSAPARITFWVCQGQPLGAVAESPEQYCTHARRLRDGVRMIYSPRQAEFVVARIHPLSVGEVHFRGAELDYTEPRRGPDRSGVEHVGMDVRVTAR
jgi:hypothetical protein